MIEVRIVLRCKVCRYALDVVTVKTVEPMSVCLEDAAAGDVAPCTGCVERLARTLCLDALKTASGGK